jgi:hypothetical protein
MMPADRMLRAWENGITVCVHFGEVINEFQ